MLLGLDCYHASGICSQETTVLILNHNHFDRLFRYSSVSPDEYAYRIPNPVHNLSIPR